MLFLRLAKNMILCQSRGYSRSIAAGVARLGRREGAEYAAP